MTKPSADNPGNQPLGLPLNNQLGLPPLPQPDTGAVALPGDCFFPSRVVWSSYSAAALQAYAAAAVAAEREHCAAWVDARRDAFCAEHGSVDPDTGTLEFGCGPHADAKNEYVGELEEIAAGLRALKA